MPPWLTATTRARAVAPRCYRAELGGCCTVARRSLATDSRASHARMAFGQPRTGRRPFVILPGVIPFSPAGDILRPEFAQSATAALPVRVQARPMLT